MNRLAILTYHSIDDSGSVISVSPAVFATQMAFLADGGFTVIPLDRAVACLRERTPFPARAVTITFDDGLENNYTEALPVLARYRFPATVFLIPGWMGRTNDWPSQPASIPRLPLLSWRQAEEMARQGITFGAHTMSHRPLTHVPPAEALWEMAESKRQIEERTGRAVRHFAFPYGDCPEHLRADAGRLFDGVCSARLGLVTQESDRLSLERLDAYYFRTPHKFRLLATGGPLTAYVSVRAGLRSIRARLPVGRHYRLESSDAPGPSETAPEVHRAS